MALAYQNAPDCVASIGSPSGSDIAAADTTDDSQKGDDFSAGTGVIYANEADVSYDRFDLGGTGTIDAVILSNGTTDSGTIWRLRQTSVGSSVMELRITTTGGNGTIEAVVNGSTSHSYQIDGWASDYFLISWAIEPNPDATGFSDDYRSELQIFNLSSGNEEFETTAWVHETPGSAGSGVFIVGAQTTTGTSAYTNDISHIRVCRAFHSSTETYETYLTSSSAPTLYGVERLEVPVLDRSDVSNLDDGEYAGPAYAMAAKAVTQLDLAHNGVLVNELMTETGRATVYSGSLDAYRKGGDSPVTPASGTVQQWLQLLYYRPVSPWVRYAHVRIFVQNYATSGTPTTTVTVFSATQPADDLTTPYATDSIEAYYTEEEVTTDHGSGTNAGEWVEFTTALRIAKDRNDFTWLSVAVTPSHNARIKAVCITAIDLEDDDGLPLSLGD